MILNLKNIKNIGINKYDKVIMKLLISVPLNVIKLDIIVVSIKIQKILSVFILIFLISMYCN